MVFYYMFFASPFSKRATLLVGHDTQKKQAIENSTVTRPSEQEATTDTGERSIITEKSKTTRVAESKRPRDNTKAVRHKKRDATHGR